MDYWELEWKEDPYIMACMGIERYTYVSGEFSAGVEKCSGGYSWYVSHDNKPSFRYGVAKTMQMAFGKAESAFGDMMNIVKLQRMECDGHTGTSSEERG